MRHRSGIRRWLGGLLLAAAGLVDAAPLLVMVEPYPPFVQERDGQLTGPFVEAFRQLTAAQGLQTRMVAMPIRRALVNVETQSGSCLLALNYSAATAEVLLYLVRVAPMYIFAYGRHGEQASISRLDQLRGRVVGSIDIAELRELLDANGIAYQPLQISGRGLQMLAARRFDVLLSDLSVELNSRGERVKLDKLFTVTRIERWLACQRDTPPATLQALRLALRDGLFAESVRPVWARYGLDEYFQQVRREWSAVTKP